MTAAPPKSRVSTSARLATLRSWLVDGLSVAQARRKASETWNLRDGRIQKDLAAIQASLRTEAKGEDQLAFLWLAKCQKERLILMTNEEIAKCEEPQLKMRLLTLCNNMTQQRDKLMREIFTVRAEAQLPRAGMREGSASYTPAPATGAEILPDHIAKGIRPRKGGKPRPEGSGEDAPTSDQLIDFVTQLAVIKKQNADMEKYLAMLEAESAAANASPQSASPHRIPPSGSSPRQQGSPRAKTEFHSPNPKAQRKQTLSTPKPEGFERPKAAELLSQEHLAPSASISVTGGSPLKSTD